MVCLFQPSNLTKCVCGSCRFLNLGHLLVLTQADGQSRHFYKSKHSEKLFDNTIGKLKTWMTRTVRPLACMRLSGRSHMLLWLGLNQCSLSVVISGLHCSIRQVDEESGTWQKAARDISFLDLNAEGLVNVDEWQHIVDSEKRGMPRYILVSHLPPCCLLAHPQPLPGQACHSIMDVPASSLPPCCLGIPLGAGHAARAAGQGLDLQQLSEPARYGSPPLLRLCPHWIMRCQ